VTSARAASSRRDAHLEAESSISSEAVPTSRRRRRRPSRARRVPFVPHDYPLWQIRKDRVAPELYVTSESRQFPTASDQISASGRKTARSIRAITRYEYAPTIYQVRRLCLDRQISSRDHPELVLPSCEGQK